MSINRRLEKASCQKQGAAFDPASLMSAYGSPLDEIQIDVQNLTTLIVDPV